MEGRLVFGAVEVGSAEVVDLAIVPPYKEADCTLEEVGAHDVCPKLRSEDVLRRELHQRRYVVVLLIESIPSYQGNGDQERATHYGEHDENIPQHPQETKKDNGV